MKQLAPASAPVLSCAAARAHEAALLRDESAEWAAMQRAGVAVAEALVEDCREIGGLPPAARVLVLAGKGHNGGDALLAAAHLLATHPAATVDVVLVFGAGPLRPLAARSLAQLHAVGGAHVRELDAATLRREFASYDVALDGVFGFQFRPPLEEPVAELLAWLNTHPRLRVRAAVDLPSGLGEAENAGTVFRADFTYCTGIVKSPVLAPAHAAYVGRVRFLDLDFFPTVAGLAEPGPHAACAERRTPGSPTPATATTALLAAPVAETVAGLVEPGPSAACAEHRAPGSSTPATAAATPFAAPVAASVAGLVEPGPAPGARVLLPALLRPLAALRPAQSDKRTFGHLVVVGGSADYPGAILMTVQAALRSGVGLLTACVPENLVPEYAARFPEAMWCGYAVNSAGGLSLAAVPALAERAARATALVLGPGLGAAPETLAAAEAFVRHTTTPLVLDADALRPALVAAAVGRGLILTPHAGEWQRLGGSVGPRAANSSAHAGEVVVVLKGYPTRVLLGAASTAPTYYVLPGGPVLARGGSGDLLAGLIGGLLAQNPVELLLVAAQGALWHARAADLWARDRGQVAVQTTQLLEYLRPALVAER